LGNLLVLDGQFGVPQNMIFAMTDSSDPPKSRKINENAPPEM